MNYHALLEKYKYYVIGGIIFASLLCLGVIFLFITSSSDEVAESVPNMFSSSSEVRESEMPPKRLYVDIKGAVNKPGMYEGTSEMRVWDALALAGGVSGDADTKQVNFSERISDQMVIYVPKLGEEIQVVEKNSENKESTEDTSKVNLNQASETELQTLPGIGQKKAQEIIRYREENGGFKSIEELKEISGFGEKTFEKLKDSITS